MDSCFLSASSSFFNVFISSSFSATDVLSLRISSLDIEEMDIREPLLSCGVLGAREDLIPVFTLLLT